MLQVFDVLHLDGCSTRALPYRERRALLEELALDGPGLAHPREHRRRAVGGVRRRVAELGLEGVVAKRLDSRYPPGRRSTAWIKHKLRRDERLAVTGVRRRPDGRTGGAVRRPPPRRRLVDPRRIDRARSPARADAGARAQTRRAARPAPWRRRLVSAGGVGGRVGPRAPRRRGPRRRAARGRAVDRSTRRSAARHVRTARARSASR